MLQNSVETVKEVQKKECPECGRIFEEKAPSYLMECDHCLSKRTE